MNPQSSGPPPAGDYSWSEYALEITTPEYQYRWLSNVRSPLPRRNHSSSLTSTPSGDILIFGGTMHSFNAALNDTWAISISGISDLPHEQTGGSMDMGLKARLVETTGGAPSPRCNHQSVLVNDLLIVWGGGSLVDNCVYTLNTTTYHWTKFDIQPAPTPRESLAICLCENRLIVFGGMARGKNLNDLWSLNVSALVGQGIPRWEQIEVAPGSPFPAERRGHMIFAYENRLYMFGGRNGRSVYNDTWCFDMATHTWTEITCSGDVPTPREYFAGALVGDAVYISGGEAADYEALGGTWRFQIHGMITFECLDERSKLKSGAGAENKWYRLPDLDLQPSARGSYTAATIEGRIFLIGGTRNVHNQSDIKTVHCLNTSRSSSVWSEHVPTDHLAIESKPSSVSAPVQVTPWSEHILEITTPESEYRDDSAAEGVNKMGPPLPRSNYASSQTPTPSGDIFLFGGQVDKCNKNDTWAISISGIPDISHDQAGNSTAMRLKARLVKTTGEAPSPRSNHGSALVNELLVVWGGFRVDNFVYTLNTNTNHWTKFDIQPAPSPRQLHAICSYGNMLILFGGHDTRDYLNDLWSLDVSALERGSPKWEQIQIVPGSPSPTGRRGHMIFAYGSQLFLFGGRAGESICNDMWCFDMATRIWAEIACSGDVPTSRGNFAGGLVGDMIYISGGWDANKKALDGTWVFRIHELGAEHKWYRIPDLDLQPSARGSYSAATIGGRVFLIGGRTENNKPPNITTIHCLDIKSISSFLPPANSKPWSSHTLNIKTPEHKYLDNQAKSRKNRVKGLGPPVPRFGHSSSTVSSSWDKVFIFGGVVDGQPTNSTWMIGISGASNPAEGGKLTSMEIIASLMETTGDRPSPRGLHQAVLYGSQLVVWGGLLSYDQPNKVARDNSVYILNTRSARWSKLDIQPAPSARFWHAVCLHESKLVVFGGAESEQQVLGDQWSLDLSTLGWGSPKWQQIQVAQGSPSPTKRGGHAMFAYQDKLYVFGGYTGKTVLNDTWCFDMTTRTWAELKCSGDVPSPRAFLAAALIGDAMYVSGGVSKAGKALGDAYIFKTNEQIWYRFPDLDLQPSARWGHSLAVYGGRVLVIGGTRNHKEPNEMTEIHSLDTSLIQYPKGAGEIIIKSGQMSHSPVIEESSVEAVESKPVDTEETEHTGMIPLREEESDSHSGEDKSTITKGDAITAEMSVIEIDRLVAHGCRDITHQLDLSQVSDYPVVSGEFSDLYRATLRTGQVVALKCRRLSAGGLEENRASIAHAAHEIYVISKCRASRRESARIIELTGVALFRDQLVMVSPWMERGNLMQFISQNPKRDPHYWCYYVVSGVANLHGLGIIHGNLKPEIISGALPYAEVNDTEVVLKVTKGEVPSRPESQLPSGVEYFDNFWAILTKCWA
ncbi:unnamed protein product [Rhizoctonia solani]|uniref:Protein kinase domain-containing protein n=1 Tax=Rhizoctonia solani TaxID=456999 RepID=A0A8H2WAE3_9AGAM|nr:unnamed protein product [Rhizoctonia solani]